MRFSPFFMCYRTETRRCMFAACIAFSFSGARVDMEKDGSQNKECAAHYNHSSARRHQHGFSWVQARAVVSARHLERV